jgi:predicted Fe-Mo cluster-binding NifX family protein
MKIAIPAQLNQLSPHFGQAESFEVFCIDPQSRTMTARWTLFIDAHAGCGTLPALLTSQGIDVVLCGGLGLGAKANLEHVGIRVVAGAPVDDVENLLRCYLDGSLVTVGGVCNHHHAGQRHHGGGHCHHGGRGHQHRQED